MTAITAVGCPLPPVVLHALGGAADLGLPLPLLLALSAGAVLGLAGLLSARTARDPARGDHWKGRRLPAWVTAAADHPAVTVAVRVLSLSAFALLLLVAALGPVQPGANPAPLVAGVGWGALTVVSLLFGPVWRRANPLRTLAAAWRRLAGSGVEHPLPAGVGMWPAAAALVAVSWLLTVGRDPLALVLVVAATAAVQVVAAGVYGRRWFAAGDPVEVWSTLLGACAPLGRDPEGHLALRSPRRSLGRLRPEEGLAGVVGVTVGHDLFDAVVETVWWNELGVGRVGGTGPVLDTLGLVVTTAVCVAAALLATRQRPFLAPALIPVAAGYALAHYLGPLVLDSQLASILLSDPFDRGWDLLGRSDGSVDYQVLPAGIAAAIQLALLVGGHLLAVTVAHDRTVARYDVRTARAVQFPFRILLIGSLLVGISLRFAAL